MDSIKLGFKQGGTIFIVGLLVGIISGWTSLLTVDGAELSAIVSAKFYFLLILLAPMSLGGLVYFDFKNNHQDYYKNLGNSILQLIVAAIIGSLVASLVFIIVSIQVPAVFGGENSAEIIKFLYPAIGLKNFIILLIVTNIFAIITAFFSNFQFKKNQQ